MHSILLLEEFQSEGTVHEVCAVSVMVVTVTSAAYAFGTSKNKLAGPTPATSIRTKLITKTVTKIFWADDQRVRANFMAFGVRRLLALLQLAALHLPAVQPAGHLPEGRPGPLGQLVLQ